MSNNILPPLFHKGDFLSLHLIQEEQNEHLLKKARNTDFLVIIAASLCACSNDIKTDVSDCAAPTKYDTLDDFLNAVKSGKEEMFCSEGRNVYYVPKNLSEGYALSSIDVLPMYLTFNYKLNVNYEEEIPLTYRWVYTGFSDGNEEAINQIKERGSVRIDYASNSLIGVYSDQDYKTEYALESRNSGNWACDYLQEGEFFQARIPWNIEPENLAEVFGHV